MFTTAPKLSRKPNAQTLDLDLHPKTLALKHPDRNAQKENKSCKASLSNGSQPSGPPAKNLFFEFSKLHVKSLRVLGI